MMLPVHSRRKCGEIVHGTIWAPSMASETVARKKWLKLMVPKGGLEPPHPCGHMTLNHDDPQ